MHGSPDEGVLRLDRGIVEGAEACRSPCRVLCQHRDTRRRPGNHCVSFYLLLRIFMRLFDGDQ